MPKNDNIKTLRADIERLIRKVDENPQASVTGYIFCAEPKFLVHFGNIRNRGRELKQLHYALSELAAGIQMGYIDPKTLEFIEVDSQGGSIALEPTENIADELAKKIIITGLEPQHSSEIMSLAHRYLTARK